MKSDLLKPAEVASLLRVSVGTLANWRAKGVGPQFLKLSETPNAPVRYRRSVVEAYTRRGDQGAAA
ncbi:helix-turn-helix transcriptional regulator [Streptomyces sp. NPDC088745]|uniref:helix-turn-helix transcriptional regulator n=1 Tax=Streptomyces sp. NPDC088745 TaxID=3365884 RepID=UPI00380DAA0F